MKSDGMSRSWPYAARMLIPSIVIVRRGDPGICGSRQDSYVNGDTSHRSVVGLGFWPFVPANTHVFCMTPFVNYDAWTS